MNKAFLIGRLTKDPDVRYTQSNMAVARYTLAVDRRFKRDGEPTADFINCIAFGKAAEFVEKYVKKGTKLAITGRIQTGSYTNKDGQRVYTTDIIAEEQEFAESKNAQNNSQESRESHETARDDNPYMGSVGEGFEPIPDDVEAEGLPWN